MDEVIRIRVTAVGATTAAIGACALFLLLAPAAFSLWDGRPHPSDQYLIDNLRRNEAHYRGLVAAKAGRRAPEEAGEIRIEESERERGPVGGRTWSRKGYAYSAEELQPLAESLDGFDGELDAGVSAYRKIEGNWYLYYWSSVEKPE